MPALSAYGEILTPRPEILEPALLLDVVDLSPVSGTPKKRGPAAAVPGREALTDPERFFDLTYPTAEIKQTLEALSTRHRRPVEVPGTILLAGRYGLGKSHVLLVARHVPLRSYRGDSSHHRGDSSYHHGESSYHRGDSSYQRPRY